MSPPARRATVSDAAELTRLRGVMLASLSDHWPDDDASDPTWRQRCTDELTRRLDTDDFAAFVVDAPDGDGLVSCACGQIDERYPGPNRGSRTGHIANVATDPHHRRQGHSRAAMTALLTWFDEQGIQRIDLHASDDGAPLYRRLGFTEGRPALRRTVGAAGVQAVAEPGTGSDSLTPGSPASE